MTETIEIRLNGRCVRVAGGSTVAAALLAAGETIFRVSESGEPRAPLCAMGICYECRVTIDGVGQRRSCMESVRPGMRIRTDAPKR